MYGTILTLLTACRDCKVTKQGLFFGRFRVQMLQ